MAHVARIISLAKEGKTEGQIAKEIGSNNFLVFYWLRKNKMKSISPREKLKDIQKNGMVHELSLENIQKHGKVVSNVK